jgi:hypothetical protein
MSVRGGIQLGCGSRIKMASDRGGVRHSVRVLHVAQKRKKRVAFCYIQPTIAHGIVE